ncbi:MAG: hypothetical protein DSZ29_01365 [Aquificaceae bacterium]|nr:MAG: hypothetical protein DSZ29_01365 [Aquificaceae bacterium]
MNKKIGFIGLGIVLLAIFIYFFYMANQASKSKTTSIVKTQAASTQVVDKEKQINKKDKAGDSLRDALQNAVQDSIDADIQEAVQSEVAKSQK